MPRIRGDQQKTLGVWTGCEDECIKERTKGHKDGYIVGGHEHGCQRKDVKME